MRDTPTKNIMNIYLLNIPFAVVGVAIAVVPLIIGMKHQARTERTGDQREVVVPLMKHKDDHRTKEFQQAA